MRGEMASIVASTTVAAPRQAHATSLLSSESYCGRAHPSSRCGTVSSVTD